MIAVIMRYVLFELSPRVQCFVVFLLLCFLGQFRFEATFVRVAWHSEFFTVIRHYVTPRFVRDRVFVVHGTNYVENKQTNTATESRSGAI
jgi:hypothetical protein